jgi:flagellar basal-body rod protein FlgG
MDKTGKIVLDGNHVHIDESGNIGIDENQVGQLKIVNFKNPEALISAGEGILRDEGKGILKENFMPKVVNGSLELSNVSAIKEMTQMIDLQRTFETYQKLIHTIDEQDKLSASRIGKVG